MKLLAALLAGLSAALVIRCLRSGFAAMPRPDPKCLTHLLEKSMARVLHRQDPRLTRYVRHITPMFAEVPLPSTLTLPLFLAWHAVAGIPLWILLSVAWPNAAILGLPVCVAIGLPLPYVWLKHKQRAYHVLLLKALPECLELQALVMEAGLDFQAGIQRYLDKGTPGPLKQLLQGVHREIQLGRSRSDAFAHLGQRTTFPALRDVCRGIIQALALGSSLAPWMREQASALRTKRMQLAEKKAAEAPLKILFPLFAFTFPTIFIVLIGPMVMIFMKGGF
jgi:pilus assembly protein TadC